MVGVSAKGRAYAGWTVAATLVMVFLAATNIWNPFPDMWGWANTSRALSDPQPAWQERVGARPDSATLAGNTLVVELNTTVEGRRISDGSRIWSREADWSAVAGEEGDSVVVAGKLLVKGYDVVDAASGALLRHEDDAVGVWTFRDAVVDVRCRGTKDCIVAAWSPRGRNQLWQAEVSGVGSMLSADNPKLQGISPLGASRIADHADGPQRMPRLLGFPIDKSVHFVDTSEGRSVQEVKPNRQEQAVAAGSRILRITASPGEGTCYFTVDAWDAVTGSRVWRESGINLRTVSGGGCQQRRTPAGSGNAVVAVAADGREAVVDANDGRVVWVGKEGEKVLAVDDRYAIVRSADGKEVSGVRLGRSSPSWTIEVRADTSATLSGRVAVITDKKPDRIIVMDPANGDEKLNVRSGAKVLAFGPDGLVVSDVRELGYLRYKG